MARQVNSAGISQMPHDICYNIIFLVKSNVCVAKLAVNEVFCKFIDSGFSRSVVDREGTSISIINVCFSKDKSLSSGSWLACPVNGAVWVKSVLIFAFWQIGHSVQQYYLL